MKSFNNEFENYKDEVHEKWGKTEEYKEYLQKTKMYSKEKWNNLSEEMNAIFMEFVTCMKKGDKPSSTDVQILVKKLQNHISEKTVVISIFSINSVNNSLLIFLGCKNLVVVVSYLELL